MKNYLLGGVFMAIMFDSGAKGEGGSSDEEKALEKVKSAIKADVEEATKELKSKLEAAEGKVKDLEDQNKKQQDHLDEMDVELQKKVGSKEVITLESELEASKEKLEKAIEGEKVEIEVKAAADMTVSFVTGGNNPYIPKPEIESGLNTAPRKDPNVMDFADTGRTNSPHIVWINKTNEEGNAEFLNEGELKPLRSFKLSNEDSNAKKIAVRFRVSTETLDDIPMLAGEIRLDGIQEVNDQVAAALLSSTGAGADAKKPKGVIAYSSAYSLTTITGEDPDYYGAIRAGAAQIRSLKFRPNAAFVNPIDGANMDLKKGANGQYVLPPFTTADGQRIGPMRIVESDEITPGKVLIGDMKRFHIRYYKGIRIEIGLDGNDFSENMRTIIVERRLHAYVKSVDTGAFLYDDFANIIAAITPESGEDESETGAEG